MTIVSSANNIGSDTQFILKGSSFTGICILNKRSPRIDPWGTPTFSVSQSQKNVLVVAGDFTSTFYLLLVKKELNQSSDTPWFSYKCNLANKLSWFKQPNAFAKSQKIPPTCIFWLIDLNTRSVSLKATFSVDIPFLKPYCSLTSMLFVRKCCFNLLCIVFSSTLEKTINN